MAGSDPPSQRSLDFLHWLQDEANYGRTYPATASETQALGWYFIKRRLGWPVDWPIPLLEGFAGGTQLLPVVAGVTSIAKLGSAQLTGDVTLSEGANITLTQVGQNIEIASSGGGGGGYVNLSDTLLSGTAASFDISGISGAYRRLLVVAILRSNEAGVIRAAPLWRLNNDSGANYDAQQIRNTGVTVSSAGTAAATSFGPGVYIGNNGTRANNFATTTMELDDYADATREKVVQWESAEFDGTLTSTFNKWSGGGRWRSTAAIDRITVLPAGGLWVAGCRFTIWGLA